MSVRPSPGSIGNAIVMSDPLGPVEAEADDRNDARPMPIHDVKDQLPPPVNSESDAEGALRSVDVLDVHDAPNGGHSVVVCNLDFAALGPAQGLGQHPWLARINTKNQLCMMVAHVVQQLSSGAVLMAPLLTVQFKTS